MNEHDDDLESYVHEDAAEETDTYPDTGDELDAAPDDAAADQDDELSLDDDKSEL